MDFSLVITHHLERQACLWSYEIQKKPDIQTHLNVIWQLKVDFSFNRFVSGADSSIMLWPLAMRLKSIEIDTVISDTIMVYIFSQFH